MNEIIWNEMDGSWAGGEGIQSHKTISWHIFRVIKLLSQYRSESTEKAVILHAQMERTNPSYFLKVTGHNGVTELEL